MLVSHLDPNLNENSKERRHSFDEDDSDPIQYENCK